jgi:hypothetical protein
VTGHRFTTVGLVRVELPASRLSDVLAHCASDAGCGRINQKPRRRAQPAEVRHRGSAGCERELTAELTVGRLSLDTWEGGAAAIGSDRAEAWGSAEVLPHLGQRKCDLPGSPHPRPRCHPNWKPRGIPESGRKRVLPEPKSRAWLRTYWKLDDGFFRFRTDNASTSVGPRIMKQGTPCCFRLWGTT